MSSELLGAAQNVLKGNLGGAWDINKGYADAYTDLGIARRFGGSSAAYSLRDIGAMNGPVVNVRREPHDTSAGIDDEINFSANQISSGALEDWVNGKLETTLPADSSQGLTVVVQHSLINSGTETTIKFYADSLTSGSPRFFSNDKTYKFYKGLSDNRYILQLTDSTNLIKASASDADKLPQDVTTYESITGTLTSITVTSSSPAAAAYSLRKVDSSYSGNAVRIRRSSDDVEVDVAFDSDDKVSSSSAITNTTEQGGESGETNATTLGDFISGTDAFVHTWYDQAGSNDAVQETASNQPKIAESGALLADGIKFNGNSDNFTITNGVSGRSIFAVTNQNIDTTGGGLTGYGQDGISSLLGTAGTNSYIFISNNNSAFNSYAISIDGAGTSDTGKYALNGKTLSSAGGNLGTYGDIPSDTNSLLSIIYNSGDPAFAWTRLGSGITSNIFMQGSMSEVILYTSDQSDNRFKIESNINNYYGLYNDANEFSGNPTSAQSSVTLSNISKTGFTATIDATSETKQVAFPFVNDLVSGNDYFVSFNYTTSDSSKTVSVKPFQSAGGSNASNDTISATTNGFYGGTGDASHNGFDVNATATVLVFQTTGTSFNFTVSDLRVSRIARNGFVQTWYDQSGNGNNAVQATAGNQPAIVTNGGLIPDGIQFDGSADALNFTDLTLTDASIFTVLDIDGTENLQLILGGSSDTTTATMIPMMQTSSSTTQVYKNSTVGGAEQGSSQFRNGSQITLNNRGDAYTQLAAQDKMLFTMIDVDVAEAKVLDGISQTPSDATTWALKGTMEELIIYNSDLSSDRGTIESEIANHYNITLS
jgi:hypothetical protein